MSKASTGTQLQKRNEPCIEYMTVDDDDLAAKKIQQQQQLESGNRSVAKKSTTKSVLPVQPVKPTVTTITSTTTTTSTKVHHLNNSTIFLEDDSHPKGRVIYYTAKKHMPPLKFKPHKCSSRCLFPITYNLKTYNPLAKPLLTGWERQILKSKPKKVVCYRAPCGIRLRSMTELHRYLRITGCLLNVDNFDFDFNVHCLAEFNVAPGDSIVTKNDLSDGRELMAIPCINYYDESMPPPCVYSTEKIPTEGVTINLDEDFLVGCDCVDDCLDKMKCSCWKLTMAGGKFGEFNFFFFS